MFFEQLCVEYYEKILRYLYAALGDEAAARDCAQEVFVLACQKTALLRHHPNPGGFLFQSAKNLARKARRESFARLLRESSLEGGCDEIAAHPAEFAAAADREIDEMAYIETVLARLSEDKRRLYGLYYQSHHSMAQIAAMLGVEETALRMRYVRLRREIRQIVAEVARQNFNL